MSEQQNTKAQQPIARISLHRVDGMPRAVALKTLDGAATLPVGEIDVYAAPVVAANEQQNTQQPVAYRWRFGSESLDTRWHYSDVPLVPYSDRAVENLYTAPPEPRDVLVLLSRWEAFGKAMLKAGSILPRNLVADTESALADRYASQVQPDPVNQQMLAALKMVLDDPDALDGRPRTYKCVMEAIAAAEATQMGEQLEQLEKVHEQTVQP